MANSKVLVKNDKVIVIEWSFEVGDLIKIFYISIIIKFQCLMVN